MITTRPTVALERSVSIGSLCTGYAGLDMGVAAALSGTTGLSWAADNDPYVTRLLVDRFPMVPNLGDLASVHWPHVEPVDVITAGFPCQDISAAGKGAGIEKGTRSSVWMYVMEAVRHLRPHLLVLENVPALRWKGRGFDRVLADLARTGYDARWCCVRAGDIGAPHRRERVFVVAHPVHQWRKQWSSHTRGTPRTGPTDSARRCALLPTPYPRVRTHPQCAHPRMPRSLARTSVAHALRERRNQGDLPPERFKRAPHTALRGHRHDHRHRRPCSTPFAYAWGDHEPAIRHWETVLGRAAPPPTETGTRGQPRLSATFVEWMMGLPAGWVTDPHLGMPHSAQIRTLGNGVVPQQATVAVRHLLSEATHTGPGDAAWD
ncbi:DNA cytosine methyltransferase [Nocardiopsis sp. NPDC055879]